VDQLDAQEDTVVMRPHGGVKVGLEHVMDIVAYKIQDCKQQATKYCFSLPPSPRHFYRGNQTKLISLPTWKFYKHARIMHS
jgi:hypothetical protein